MSAPSTGFLDPDAILANARALGPAIEDAAADIARQRRLPDDLVEAMRRAGIFRIAFPSDLWAALCRGDAPTLEMRAGVGLMSVHAIQTALQVAEIVCEAAGTSAAHASGPFDRRRRDLTTISAHLVGQRRAFQTAGQLLFGDDVPTFV
ncbi:MAG TPA: hypothetical protein VL049_25300 [Candidatus Dormibacteraeota bacterium]|nr:hypothetical protein [Candidatus Dormibacteraeota bacterium]